MFSNQKPNKKRENANCHRRNFSRWFRAFFYNFRRFETTNPHKIINLLVRHRSTHPFTQPISSLFSTHRVFSNSDRIFDKETESFRKNNLQAIVSFAIWCINEITFSNYSTITLLHPTTHSKTTKVISIKMFCSATNAENAKSVRLK